MAQDPKEDINESIAYIRDTLSSVSAIFAEQLKDATKNAFSTAEATTIKDLTPSYSPKKNRYKKIKNN